MKKLVIVGCGRLGGIVAEAVIKGILPEYDLVGVYSRTVSKAESMAARMQEQGKPCLACTTIADLLALKPDYLVEAASPAAMRELAIPTLKNGTSIVTLSIGALADDDFYREVSETAKARGNVHAKTGSVTGVSSLAGYVKAANGHQLAFVIINQNVLKLSRARAFQDKFCDILSR